MHAPPVHAVQAPVQSLQTSLRACLTRIPLLALDGG